MQKRKNRWYIAVVAVVILAVVLVLAVVLGKKGKNKKDPKMIEPTQQEQASEIPTETEEVFDYSATETAETYGSGIYDQNLYRAGSSGKY